MSDKKELWNRFVQHAMNAKTTRLEKHEIRKRIRDYPVFCDVDPENVKVMLVSEQAVHNEEFHEKYQQMGCRAYLKTKKATVPKTVKEFLGDDIFKNSFEGRGPIYWSHAIKYPLKEGKFRRKSVRFFIDNETIENDYEEEGNAWFLKREIEILEPSIIVSFGGCGAKLLPHALMLEDIIDEKLWKIVKRELEMYMDSGSLGFRCNGRKYVVLYHPSGKNPGGKAVNEFFKERLRQMIKDEIEKG
ncbi:MAG: hypothetical protein E3J35_09275 [Methanomassiliicoccales archaeon]|nr:MAG: hypothetical protein E3J35_09275 [Methanomassiliicoccales archaeon]